MTRHDFAKHQGLLSWFRFSLIWLIICGLVYPVITTLVAGKLFPWQAEGSLLMQNGKAIGSKLVGQAFTREKYFIGRPSAAGYDPPNASSSNLASSNPALRLRAMQTAQTIAKRENIPLNRIPVDLIAASGSGLDPHISLKGAEVQIQRIARVRALSEEYVRELIRANTELGTLGLGKPGVNVLRLNLALDTLP